MKCDKCPATAICSDYQHIGFMVNYEKCCFGREEGPGMNTCRMCEVRELCKQCSGCGENTVIVKQEYVNVHPADYAWWYDIPEGILPILEEV